MMTFQAKISLLLESLQNHNTEDALFPHFCRIEVIIIVITVNINIIIINNNNVIMITIILILIMIMIMMMMIIFQSASDLLCIPSAWLKHVRQSHVCLLSGIINLHDDSFYDEYDDFHDDDFHDEV